MTKLNYLFVHVLATLENLKHIETREEGQGLVEYALIIALVSIALIAALGLLTGALNGVFGTISNTLKNVPGG